MINYRQIEDPRREISTVIIAGLLQMALIFPATKETGWLVVLCATAIIVPICILYGKITAIAGSEFLTVAFGRLPGKIIKILYILFFLLTASIDIRQSSNLLAGGMFPGFSPIVLPLLLVPLIFYASKKETLKVARLGFILFASALLLTALDFLLQISQIEIYNFLPVINTNATSFVKMVFYCVTVVMGKIPILLFVFNKQGTSGRRYLTASLWGCGFLLLVAIRDTGILGTLLPYMNLSVFETVQLLDAFGFLSRIEILFVFMHIVCVTYVVCLWVGASTDIFTQTFNVKNKKNSIVILSFLAIIFVVSVFAFKISAFLRNFIINFLPFISVWFVVIFPVMAFVLLKTRKKIR